MTACIDLTPPATPAQHPDMRSCMQMALKPGMSRFNISNDASYGHGQRKGAGRAGAQIQVRHAMPALTLSTIPPIPQHRLHPWYLLHRPRGGWVPLPLQRLFIVKNKKGACQRPAAQRPAARPALCSCCKCQFCGFSLQRQIAATRFSAVRCSGQDAARHPLEKSLSCIRSQMVSCSHIAIH